MKFSLILATVDRTPEVARFLEALDRQTYRRFELIVVDQNSENRMDRLLEQYKDHLQITHLRAPRGLSRARNLGIAAATGDVFAFPDDDCWYPNDLLESVTAWFATSHPDAVAGRAVDSAGRASGDVRWDRDGGAITTANVWRRAISFTVFLRKQVVERVGPFDETLGAGSGTPWLSGEETDYLLRAMAAGFRIWYDPHLTVHHDHPARTSPSVGFAYGMGMGRVLRRYKYARWFAMLQILRPAGGAVLSLAGTRLTEAQYRWAVFRGRLHGWTGS